jgi:phage antirepressor YoqD-like protein
MKKYYRTQNECYRQEIVEYQEEIAIMQPKAIRYDRFLNSDNLLNMHIAADILGIPGYGRNNLFKFLRENHVLCGGKHNTNIPYRHYIDNNYFSVKHID